VTWRAKGAHEQPLRMIATAALLAGLALSPAQAGRLIDPLRFFEGRTECVSMMNVLMKKPVRMSSFGRGAIGPDGTLVLVQRVEQEGQQPYARRWQIREVAPDHFSGSMSEAEGPVTIERVGGRYRFRFRMKGALSVEQWLIPQPGGRSAISTLLVRKLGFAVARSEGMIRKVD
jgi:hypothetical protein